ncbi:MAG TPA: hypothetical protein VIM30_07610 [Candidatus Limnocylindrales bacterium]
MTASPDVTAAIARLQSRWGAAAPRRLGTQIGNPIGDGVATLDDTHRKALDVGAVGEVVGALATVPLEVSLDGPLEAPSGVPFGRPVLPGLIRPGPTPYWDGVVSTGFPALDAILGPGGLPRSASVAFGGEASSGKTTIALRLVAEAQAAGSIVAWLDLARSFDPVEALARGVRPEWLVVVTPETLDEGLAIGGALLSGRAVDLLLIDLPAHPPRSNPAGHPPGSAAHQPGGVRSPGVARPPSGVRPPSVARPPTGVRPASVGDRLGRLAALARRSEALLVVLEPPGLGSRLTAAIAESTGLRLELARRSWIHLGRDVVGQRTEVTVARNRFGPPGRRAELRILYANGGERDACLNWDGLLSDERLSDERLSAERLSGERLSIDAPTYPVPGNRDHHATAPPLLAAPPPRTHTAPLRLVPARTDRHRRPAMDGRPGSRRRPGGTRIGRPTGDASWVGAPAGTRGDLRRSGSRS